MFLFLNTPIHSRFPYVKVSLLFVLTKYLPEIVHIQNMLFSTPCSIPIFHYSKFPFLQLRLVYLWNYYTNSEIFPSIYHFLPIYPPKKNTISSFPNFHCIPLFPSCTPNVLPPPRFMAAMWPFIQICLSSIFCL